MVRLIVEGQGPGDHEEGEHEHNQERLDATIMVWSIVADDGQKIVAWVL
jgi:hypothetical protein